MPFPLGVIMQMKVGAPVSYWVVWPLSRVGGGWGRLREVRQVRLCSAALGTNQSALRPHRAEPLKGPVGAARTPLKTRLPGPAGSGTCRASLGPAPVAMGMAAGC